MPAIHPVHALQAKLEDRRLKLVEELAAAAEPSTDRLSALAALQAALMAVREEIEAHGPRLGWGDRGELS